jgi:nucleoside-diphosphate-sugar epimerase
MRVLIIGGTGLISTGIVKHLLARKADVTMYNRGQRESTLPENVKELRGDRNNFAEFEKQFKDSRYDVVIDMICFNGEQAQSAVNAFGGGCEQLIFCSTVCSYGFKVPPGLVVDETFPQEPTSGYGRGKVLCEQIFKRAHDEKKFKTTIIRPSCTYGPGSSLIDNLEFNPVSYDRIEKGLPVLCADSGLGIWVATHRDDCGKLFAYAALNKKTYGEAYNATRDENFTWRDWFREAAAALGKKAQLVFMPAEWIANHDTKRFALLKEISQFHGAYSSAKAKRDVPEFKCEIDFQRGAAETLADVKRRKAWRDSSDDALYQSMIDKALKAGVEPVEA